MVGGALGGGELAGGIGVSGWELGGLGGASVVGGALGGGELAGGLGVSG